MMNHLTKSSKNSNESPGSIEKAMILLEALASEPCEFTVPELAEKTGFNRTTVYRTLRILMSGDFVMFDKAQDKYKIGYALYHVGTKYLYNKNYHDKIMEILVEISEVTKESVGMAVKDGNKIMSLLEVEIHQPMKFNDFPGKYFPPNKGCYGKCLMAYQSEEYIAAMLDGQTFEKTCYNTLTQKEELIKEYAKIRKQGYVTSVDELGIDIVGTGIPIFGHNGQVKATVAVAFYKDEGWTDKLDSFTRILLKYQEQIGKCMP